MKKKIVAIALALALSFSCLCPAEAYADEIQSAEPVAVADEITVSTVEESGIDLTDAPSEVETPEENADAATEIVDGLDLAGQTADAIQQENAASEEETVSENAEEEPQEKKTSGLTTYDLSAILTSCMPTIRGNAIKDVSWAWNCLIITASGSSLTSEESATLESVVDTSLSKIKNSYNKKTYVATTWITEDKKVRFNNGATAAKTIICVAAMGYDPTNYKGYDLCYFLDHSEETVADDVTVSLPYYPVNSGVYVAPYELWAVNYVGYDMNSVVKDGIISALVSGRSNWMGNNPDAAGPVLLALAPYMNRTEVAEAVNATVAEAAAAQLTSGGWASKWSGENSNSIAELIMGLAAVGVNPYDSRFVKTDEEENQKSMVDGLMQFYTGSTFNYTATSAGSGILATQQSCWALVSMILQSDNKLMTSPIMTCSNTTEEEQTKYRITFTDLNGKILSSVIVNKSDLDEYGGISIALDAPEVADDAEFGGWYFNGLLQSTSTYGGQQHVYLYPTSNMNLRMKEADETYFIDEENGGVQVYNSKRVSYREVE